MNSKKFLTLFLLLLCLFAFVRAADEGYGDDEIPEAEEEVDDEEAVAPKEEAPKEEAPKPTTTVAPKPAPTTEAPKPAPTTAAPKPAPTTAAPKPVQTTAAPKPAATQAPAPAPVKVENKPAVSAPSSSSSSSSSSSKPSTSGSSSSSSSSSNSSSSSPSSSGSSGSSSSPSTSSSSSDDKSAPATSAAPASNAAAPADNAAAAPANNGNIVNPIVPATNGNNKATTPNNNNKPATNGPNTANANNENNEEKGNGVVKTTVISLVAVGAVVGVATVGVRVYNKKTNDRGIDLGDIEAQPINNDFGKSNNDLSGMPPEEYNPYNIMNDAPNEPYVTNNNPYEYKPNYEDVIDTTPFNKAENAQDNFMSRESIFSNPANNIPQIGNDVFNFGDNTQLPYVQEHPIENSYIEEPVANQISVENNDMPNSQMPTLVPVQPEIVITSPDEEPAQEGYKQIVPTVAQMEIIETPDFNNMTTSMIEDHINNMDLENLANTETQQQEDIDTGYKQIVPDIQEAVIENFDIDDDEEDPDMSVVDNITDTYRAALRATYCSTATDENRFSYRTVDSDHSLLHTMREDGQW